MFPWKLVALCKHAPGGNPKTLAAGGFVAILTLANMIWSGPDKVAPSFMDALPDPMKLEWPVLTILMGMVALLYILLKTSFFQPIAQLMDERDQEMEAGTQARLHMSQLLEERQAQVQSRLKEIRAQAYEQKKRLVESAQAQRSVLLEDSRNQAAKLLNKALQELDGGREEARRSLVTQVDELASLMVKRLVGS